MNKRYIDFVPANNNTRLKGSAQTVVKKTTVVRTIEEAPVELSDEPIEALIEIPVEAPVRVQKKAPVRLAKPARQTRTVRSVRTNPQPRPAMVARTRIVKPASAARKTPAVSTPTTATRKMPVAGGPALGVVEDLNSHFVNTNVPKRPLSEKPVQSVRRPTQLTQRSSQPSVTDLKAKKVKASLATKTVAKATKKPTSKPASKVGLSKESATYKAPKPTFINQNKVVKRPLSGGNVYHKQTVKSAKEEPKGPVTIIAKPEKDKHIGIIVTIIITIILGAAAGTVAFLLLPK